MTLRDAATLRPLRRFPVDAPAGASTVSPDGRLAALGAPDGSVRFLDLRSGKLRRASGHHDAPVRDARFTPDGRTLVTAGEDAKLMLWNVPHASASETLDGHAGPVREVAVSPDGETAYTASLDGSAIVWISQGRGASDAPSTPLRSILVARSAAAAARAERRLRTRATCRPR